MVRHHLKKSAISEWPSKSLVLVSIDRTHVISYQSSIVTISLLHRFWNTITYFPQILRGHVTLNTPILWNFNMHLAVLITIKLHTKFEMSSFICLEVGHVTLTTPTWWTVCHSSEGYYYYFTWTTGIQKFEVSSISCSKDILLGEKF